MLAHAVCDEGESEKVRLKSGQQLQHLLLRTAIRSMCCCYALPKQLSLPLLSDSHDQQDTSLVPVLCCRVITRQGRAPGKAPRAYSQGKAGSGL